MKRLLGIVVLGLFLSSSSYANILNIKCQFDQTREPGFGNKTKKNWFASFKDKMGYKFDIKNLKLIETSYGKYSQKLSLPININDDPKERDFDLKQIQGTFSSIPKSNQKGTPMIFVYEISIGTSEINEEIFFENVNQTFEFFTHFLNQYKVSQSAMNEWLNFSPSQSYDDFQRWIKKDVDLSLASGWAVGECDLVK